MGNGFLKAYAFDFFFKWGIHGVELQRLSVACLYVFAFSTLVANYEWIFKNKTVRHFLSQIENIY